MDATAEGFALVREGERNYRITGTVRTPQGGWTVELRPESEGIVPKPELAVFRLVGAAPAIGTDALSEHAVDHAFTDDPSLTRAVIRLTGVVGPDGAASLALDLTPSSA